MILVKPSEIDFNKWTNYFFIAFAFAIPISKALISLFAVLIIVSWVLEGNYRNKFEVIKCDKLSLIFLFLITFSIISLLWSPNLPHAVKFIGIKYWHFFLIPIMLTSFNTKYIKYVINSFLLSMFISEIVSYGIFFEIWSYNNVPSSDPSPFMNHTDYSTFLSFALIIILSKLMTITDLKWKIFYLFYFVTGLSNLFINGGRTGQVTFLFTISVMAIFYFKLSIKYIITLFITLVTILTIAYNVSPNFHNRVNQVQADLTNMYEKNEYSGSLSIRIALWRIGAATFMDNTVIGTGIGGETLKIKEYSEKLGFHNLETFTDYHNTFIQYGVQLGIIGFLIPITVFYLLFTLRLQNRQYKSLSVAFTIIYILHAMGGFSFHILDSLVFLCTFAALFNAISYQDRLKLNAI